MYSARSIPTLMGSGSTAPKWCEFLGGSFQKRRGFWKKRAAGFRLQYPHHASGEKRRFRGTDTLDDPLKQYKFCSLASVDGFRGSLEDNRGAKVHRGFLPGVAPMFSGPPVFLLSKRNFGG